MQALVGKTIRYITLINRLFPFSRHYYSLLMSLNQCFSLNRMNNTKLARTLSWRELEIANTEHWAKWKGKTHFSRNEKKQLTAVTLGDTSGLVVALQKACTSTTSIL